MRWPAGIFQSADHRSRSIVPRPADQVALARDQRPGAVRVEVVDVETRLALGSVVVDVDPGAPGARQVHGVRQRRRDRPDARLRAVEPVALAVPSSRVGAGAQRASCTPLASAGGQLCSARHLPSLVWTAIGGSATVGAAPLRKLVVEAHDLVEPAGAAHLQAAALVGLVAADVLPRAEPGALVAGVVLQVLRGAVGDRVVLGQALGEEQRHVRARRRPGSGSRSSSTPSRGRRCRPGRRSWRPGSRGAGCRWRR